MCLRVFEIVAITLMAYWIVGTVVFFISKQNETVGCLWAMGLVYPVLYALFYPIRAIKTYNASSAYYQKRGISRVQYLFGKRIRRKQNDEA